MAFIFPKQLMGADANCESTLSEQERAAANAWTFGIAPMVMSLAHHEFKMPDGILSHFSRPFDQSTNLMVGLNSDVLISEGWLDLSLGPYRLHTPNTKGTFFVIQLMDGFSNTFASLGTVETGSKAVDYLLLGPKGEIQDKDYSGIQIIRAPTDLVGIRGRIAVKHVQPEFDRANRMQKRIALIANSSRAKTSIEKTDFYPEISRSIKQSIPWRILAMDAADFFPFLQYVLKEIPPLAEYGEIKKSLAALGVLGSEKLDWNSLPPDKKLVFIHGLECGKQRFWNYVNQSVLNRTATGWSKPEIADGNFGTDYLRRATIAVFAPAANVTKVAVYLTNQIDDSRQQLYGKNQYRIHFPLNSLPPAKAYWSLTAYDEKNFLVPNAIHRYSIGSLDPDLVKNSDGSIDIYFSNKEPTKEFKNWLPTPMDFFSVTLRIYWPEERAVNGNWSPPAIVKLK